LLARVIGHEICNSSAREHPSWLILSGSCKSFLSSSHHGVIHRTSHPHFGNEDRDAIQEHRSCSTERLSSGQKFSRPSQGWVSAGGLCVGQAHVGEPIISAWDGFVRATLSPNLLSRLCTLPYIPVGQIRTVEACRRALP
jgi:hypothetical protein